MRQQISFLTQSRFYSPAFNAAIFDGPIRIYFAQYQESVALKVYFTVQERVKELYSDVRESFRRTGMNIFVMIYPSSESFRMSFEGATQNSVVVDRLGHDFVVGVSGPLNDSDVTVICDRIEEIARSLTDVIPPPALQRTAEEAGF